MKCERLQDQFVEYLLNELSDREMAVVEQHLRSRCERCELEIQRVQEGIELLVEAAPCADMSQHQLDALVRRAQQAVAPRMDFEPLARNGKSSVWSTGFRILQYAASLAAGVLFVLLLTRNARPPAIATALQPSAGERIDPSNTAWNSGSNSENGPGLLRQKSERGTAAFVSLKNRSQDPQGIGFAVVDAVVGELHFLAKRVPPPPPGSQYVLWIVSLQSEVRIPLMHEASGFCKAIVPLPIDPVRHIEVRLESLDGAVQAVDHEALMSADIEA